MRATTIRFSEPIYERLDRASKYTGLPINAIVTMACMDWLRQQFSPTEIADVSSRPSGSNTAQRLLGGQRMALHPPLSSDVRQALDVAEQEARRFGHGYIGTEHLLLAIAADEESPGGQGLVQTGLSGAQIREAFQFIIGQAPTRVADELDLGGRAAQLFERAAGEARARRDQECHTGHLLLAVLADPECAACHILESLTDLDDVRTAAERSLA